MEGLEPSFSSGNLETSATADKRGIEACDQPPNDRDVQVRSAADGNLGTIP